MLHKIQSRLSSKLILDGMPRIFYHLIFAFVLVHIFSLTCGIFVSPVLYNFMVGPLTTNVQETYIHIRATVQNLHINDKAVLFMMLERNDKTHN